MALVAGQIGDGIGVFLALALYGFACLTLACPKCSHQLFLRNGIWFPWPLKVCEQCGQHTDDNFAARDV